MMRCKWYQVNLCLCLFALASSLPILTESRKERRERLVSAMESAGYEVSVSEFSPMWLPRALPANINRYVSQPYISIRAVRPPARSISEFRDGLEEFSDEIIRVKLAHSSSWDRIHLTDTDIRTLSKLKDLEELAIGGDQLTDHGLKGIEELRSLSSLSIYGDRITDDGISFLSVLVNLRYVSLCGKNIGDSTFRQLAQLPDVRILHFVATGLSDNSFDGIELEACSTERHDPFPKLQSLCVSNSSISDHWCSKVSRLSVLKTLDVSYSSITDTGFHQILRQCRGLTSLFASQCDLQGDEWISGEWNCELETLAIGDDNLTGSDVLKLYRRHPGIKSILGYGCCISDSERSELRQFLRDRHAVSSR